MSRRAAQPIHEVVFYTYPKYLFVWPLMAVGLILWPLTPDLHPTQTAVDQPIVEQPAPDAPETAPVAETDPVTAAPEIIEADQPTEVQAWIYGITLIVVLVTLGFDLDRNHAFLTIVILGLFWALIVIMRMKGVMVFDTIYRFFADLNPSYSRNLGLIVSIVLLVFYFVMLVLTRLNSRWRVTHNEFEHYQFGRIDDSLARGAKRIRASYPDLFEYLICFAGDLVIFDASGNRELTRIPHVPMLPWVKKKINRLMESTAVSAAILEDELGDLADDDDQDRTL